MVVSKMRVVTLSDLSKLVERHTFDQFILDLIEYLKHDFSTWEHFDKSPRHVIHVDGGVLELMPVANKKHYTYKYVNGHPKNPKSGKMTIVATGQLSLVDDGYPLMYSEMTLLTAFRTAATAALATDLLARKNSSTLALIGTGAQSEFQLLANCLVRDITTVKYFDTDPKAMDKFSKNINARNTGLNLIACANAKEAVDGADIITVCTAEKAQVDVVMSDWILPGMHINGLGGDCPGKTELELPILHKSKIVVEYLPQSEVEGEIQRLSNDEVKQRVHAELWELITNKKIARASENEITLFDSVGFALEDFSVLRLVYDLAVKYNIGHDMDILPDQIDPKDLISLLTTDSATSQKLHIA